MNYQQGDVTYLELSDGLLQEFNKVNDTSKQTVHQASNDDSNSDDIGAASRSDPETDESNDLPDNQDNVNFDGHKPISTEVINQSKVSEINSELRDVKLIHTPDLVMDLPTQPDENVLILESPDMTSAERFAKQNQCTLKKNTKPTKPITEMKANVSPKSPLKIKPEIGMKPEISIKPVCLLQVNKEAKQ